MKNLLPRVGRNRHDAGVAADGADLLLTGLI